MTPTQSQSKRITLAARRYKAEGRKDWCWRTATEFNVSTQWVNWLVNKRYASTLNDDIPDIVKPGRPSGAFTAEQREAIAALLASGHVKWKAQGMALTGMSENTFRQCVLRELPGAFADFTENGLLNRWRPVIADYAAGMTMPQLAERYGLGIDNVRKHLSNFRKVLGTEAVPLRITVKPRTIKTMSTGAGKGDTPRKVSGEAFRESYDRIFRKKAEPEKKVCRRCGWDADGELCDWCQDHADRPRPY